MPQFKCRNIPALFLATIVKECLNSCVYELWPRFGNVRNHTYQAVNSLDRYGQPTSNNLTTKMAKIVNMEKIQSAIGYIFRSNTLAVEALESTGHARIVSGKADGHKRLALLGNAVLGLVQLDRWYRTQQSREIADLLLKKHATNRRLQECADRLGITSEILVAPEQAYLHLQGGQIGRVTSASAIEALLGAVWLDSNRDFEQVKKVACKLGVVDNES